MKTIPVFENMAFHWDVGSCHDFPRLARESGFLFSQNRGRIDWNKIGAIDVDKIVRERDLETLQAVLPNIMSCSLDSEYDLKVLDPNFVKLFRLAQLATDFLLYCRNFLDHCVTVIQEQLRDALQNVEHIQKLKKEKTEEIISLRKKLKSSSRSCKTRSVSPKPHFKCSLCKKDFVGEQYLLKHQERRHPELSGADSPSKEQSGEVESLRQQVHQLQDRLRVTEEALKLNTGPVFPDLPSFQAILQSELQKIKASENISAMVTSPVVIEDCTPVQTQSTTQKDQNRSDCPVASIEVPKSCANGKVEVYTQQSQTPLLEQEKIISQPDQREMLDRIEQQNDEIKALRDQLLRLHEEHESILQKKLEELQQQHRTDLDQLRLSITKDLGSGSHPVISTITTSLKDYAVEEMPLSSQENFQAWEKLSAVNIPNDEKLLERNVSEKEKERVPIARYPVTVSMEDSNKLKAREEPVIEEEYVSPTDHESSESSSVSSSSDAAIAHLPLDKAQSKTTLNESKSMYSKSGSSSSASGSESGSSSYDSDSQSVTSEKQPSRTVSEENKPRFQLTPQLLDGLKEDLVGLLNRRMRDLGIDPEWDRLPVKSFNSTMATVKHHQNIAAKTYQSYYDVQEVVKKEVEKRLAEKLKTLQLSQSTTATKRQHSSGSISIFARLKSHVKNKLSHSGRLSTQSQYPQKTAVRQKSDDRIENVYSQEPSTSRSTHSPEYEILHEKLPAKLTEKIPETGHSSARQSMTDKDNGLSRELHGSELVTNVTNTELLPSAKPEDKSMQPLSAATHSVKSYSRSMYANLSQADIEIEKKRFSSDSGKDSAVLKTSTPIKTGIQSSSHSSRSEGQKAPFVSPDSADIESISELESDYNDIIANTTEKGNTPHQTRAHTTLTTAELLANVAKFRQNSMQLNLSQSVVKSNLKSSLSTGNIMKKKVVFRDEKDGFDTIELGPSHSSYESSAPQRSHSENSLATTNSSPRFSDQPVPTPRSSLSYTSTLAAASNVDSTDSDWDWDKDGSESSTSKKSGGRGTTETQDAGLHRGDSTGPSLGADKQSSMISLDGTRVADIVKDIEKKLQEQSEKPSFGMSYTGSLPTELTKSTSASRISPSFQSNASGTKTNFSLLSRSSVENTLEAKSPDLLIDDFSSG